MGITVAQADSMLHRGVPAPWSLPPVFGQFRFRFLLTWQSALRENGYALWVFTVLSASKRDGHKERRNTSTDDCACQPGMTMGSSGKLSAMQPRKIQALQGHHLWRRKRHSGHVNQHLDILCCVPQLLWLTDTHRGNIRGKLP